MNQLRYKITDEVLKEASKGVSEVIPISEALLLRNGFIRHSYMALLSCYHLPDEHYVTFSKAFPDNDGRFLCVRFRNGIIYDIDASNDKYWTSTFKIKYVHELSYLMRLFDLGELA